MVVYCTQGPQSRNKIRIKSTLVFITTRHCFWQLLIKRSMKLSYFIARIIKCSANIITERIAPSRHRWQLQRLRVKQCRTFRIPVVSLRTSWGHLKKKKKKKKRSPLDTPRAFFLPFGVYNLSINVPGLTGTCHVPPVRQNFSCRMSDACARVRVHIHVRACIHVSRLPAVFFPTTAAPEYHPPREGCFF